jgi:hypothetical protein
MEIYQQNIKLTITASNAFAKSKTQLSYVFIKTVVNEKTTMLPIVRVELNLGELINGNSAHIRNPIKEAA